MTELIYLIASHEDCCIKSKLLSNVDAAKENFEQIVYDHIFKDISIEELARLTSGERITGATLEAAGELLDSAERFKRALTQQK